MPGEKTLSQISQPKPGNKAALKSLMGELPIAAELYWQIWQQGKAPFKGMSMHRIETLLPELRRQVEAAASQNLAQQLGIEKRRILLFVTLRYWIEHGAVLAFALAGLGHQVTMLYLPYNRWDHTPSRFDSRRMTAYSRKVLSQAYPIIRPISLLDIESGRNSAKKQSHLPADLKRAIQQVSIRDTQYTLQVEDVQQDRMDTPSGSLYHLRLRRNFHAAETVKTWLTSLPELERPELLLTPNGSILEMGAVYQLARFLEIPAVTYEFGEQRGRIWLAKNSEVMRQETDELWGTTRDLPLNDQQWERMRALYYSRQNASLWENFGRLWQGQPTQGGEEVHQALSLDSRPVVLLAANVIGDSLTLGRQVFSQNMTEWLESTVRFFANRPDVQLIVRIHPGERYTNGPSVAQVVQKVLPEVPEHIRLILALDPVNTYDLLEIADLGLVYTTTVGMEMAMCGLPVIVAGATHYRQKGFTLDPESWKEYYQHIEKVLSAPQQFQLNPSQVECAWKYAYRFYFNFPCAFPWHLLDFTETLNQWPMARALSDEGFMNFSNAYRYLSGEPRDWRSEAA